MSIYFQKVGKGKDLILLHGWSMDVSTWWPVVDLLKEDLPAGRQGFTLWLLDLPGFGKSDLPNKTWSVEDYADEIANFIREHRIKKPALLGHSFGGSVAIKLASKYPNLISKLILESSSGIRPKPNLLNRLFTAAAKLIKLFPNLLNIKEKLRNWFYKLIGSDYLTTGKLKKTFLKVIRQDLSADASKIPHETLIIWGENDKTLPLDRSKKLYQLIKNSRLEVMEEVGHTPHIKNPSFFTNYVKDFI